MSTCSASSSPLKNRPSAVEFPTHTRLHVSLRARDLGQSRAFYEKLFNQPPTKVRPGYVKFEVLEPPVNFVLNEDPGMKPGGALSHFGVQVKSTAVVTAAQARLAAAGLETLGEEQTDCCHAVQDKIWVRDPDGHQWEFFVVTQADAPARSAAGAGDSACCATDAAPATAAVGCCTPDPAADAAISACCAPARGA
jgi:catechol 2,3-dioxygenase-like lactoylglutathione lyase family enzyme